MHVKEEREEREKMKKLAKGFTLSIVIMLLLSTGAIMQIMPTFGQVPPTADMYFKPWVNDFWYTAPDQSPYTYGQKFPGQRVQYDEIADVGDWFLVEVRLANYTEVYAWQFRMFFNPTYVRCTKAVYAPPADFIFGTAYTPVSPVIDNGVGSVTFYANSMPWAPFSGTDIGLAILNFTVIKEPPEGIIYSFDFTFAPETPAPGTWIQWEDNSFLPLNRHTATYSIEGRPPPPAYLEISPTVYNMPVIPGDRIVDTGREYFDVPIYIRDVRAKNFLVLVQLSIIFDYTLIDAVWIYEGTFMNDSRWAIYGTTDNYTIIDPGRAFWFILLNPNPSTGEWDQTQFPEGGGLLCTARFKVVKQLPDGDGVAPFDLTGSSPLDLEGVNSQYFVSANETYITYRPAIDGTCNVYCYAWKRPDADFTWTPETPLVEEVVTFDASASVGYRNINGTLTPDNTYITRYFWDFGDGTNATRIGVGNFTVQKAYLEMGEYDVTLTVTDKDGRTGNITKRITVIFGRLIDVFVGECGTPFPAPYGGQKTSNPEKGIYYNADMFEPQKTVCVWALVTYNGEPVQFKLVAFEVISPTGRYSFTRTAFTNATGYAYIEFGLPWPCENYSEVLGIWTIWAKVDIRCTVVQDVVRFKCWWLLEITSVVPKQTEFVKLGRACFDVTFRTYRMRPFNALITVTVYDDLNVPIGKAYEFLQGLGWGNYTWCQFKNYTITICIEIPKWAFVGTGTVYANAYSDWPRLCGDALCPEKSATFKIKAQ